MDVNATPVLNAHLERARTYTAFWDTEEAGLKQPKRLKYAGVNSRFPHAPEDSISMWIADLNIRPPKEVIRSLQQSLAVEYGYQIHDIGQAVSKWHSQKDPAGLQFPVNIVLPDYVVDATSTIGIIDTVLRTYCNDQDEVMFLSPGYPPLRDVITLNKLVPSPVELRVPVQSEGTVGNTEVLDIGSLNKDAKAFLLCHPNNPTGTVLSAENQADIIRFCEAHNILLIVDEVHSDFGFLPEAEPTTIPLFGEEKGLMCSPNVVHVHSASKTFNLASIPGASYAIIADKKMRESITKALHLRHLYANNVSKLALILAYEKAGSWLKQVRSAIAFNRHLVSAFFNHYKIDATYTMGAAGYFLWLSVPSITFQSTDNTTRNNPVNVKHLLSADDCIKSGVLGSDGKMYGFSNFVRLNLACSPETVERALNRIFFH